MPQRPSCTVTAVEASGMSASVGRHEGAAFCHQYSINEDHHSLHGLLSENERRERKNAAAAAKRKYLNTKRGSERQGNYKSESLID